MIDLSRFFSKKDQKSLVKTDIHSHILPSIDDGAKDLESAVSLVSSLKDLGYKKLIATPHIKSGQYNNNLQTIKKSYEKLKNELEKKDICIDIEFAAEYFVDENFYQLLEKKDLLIFGDNYLLFEFSYIYKPFNLYELIYEIETAGYKPVLAHPERYIYFHSDFKIYKKLKEREVFFQLNLNSLSGYYSKPVQKIAKKLCDNSMVDFIGSDTHHYKHINSLKKTINSSYYKKIFKKNAIINDKI